MTYQPEADKPEPTRCPLGFSINPTPGIECGHAQCYPETCTRLARLGIVIECANWETGK